MHRAYTWCAHSARHGKVMRWPANPRLPYKCTVLLHLAAFLPYGLHSVCVLGVSLRAQRVGHVVLEANAFDDHLRGGECKPPVRSPLTERGAARTPLLSRNTSAWSTLPPSCAAMRMMYVRDQKRCELNVQPFGPGVLLSWCAPTARTAARGAVRVGHTAAACRDQLQPGAARCRHEVRSLRLSLS